LQRGLNARARGEGMGLHLHCVLFYQLMLRAWF